MSQRFRKRLKTVVGRERTVCDSLQEPCAVGMIRRGVAQEFQPEFYSFGVQLLGHVQQFILSFVRRDDAYIQQQGWICIHPGMREGTFQKDFPERIWYEPCLVGSTANFFFGEV